MEKVYSIRTWLCAVVILVVHFAIAAMAEVPKTDSLIEDLIAVSRDSEDASVRKSAILARPEADVRAAIDETLESANGTAIALRAIEVLQLKGFEEKLRGLVKTTTEPDVVFGVNRVLAEHDKQMADVYRARLEALAGRPKNSLFKIAFVNGLTQIGEPLSEASYKTLLNDFNEEVGLAAVRNLSATIQLLKPADQKARAKPAQQSHSKRIQSIARTLPTIKGAKP